jgi:hypothetical protein
VHEQQRSDTEERDPRHDVKLVHWIASLDRPGAFTALSLLLKCQKTRGFELSTNLVDFRLDHLMDASN